MPIPPSSHFYSSQDLGHGMMPPTFKGWVFPSQLSLFENPQSHSEVCLLCDCNLAKLMVKINHHTNITGDQVSGALWIDSVVHWLSGLGYFSTGSCGFCESWWKYPWFCSLWDGHIPRRVLSRTCYSPLELCQ